MCLGLTGLFAELGFVCVRVCCDAIACVVVGISVFVVGSSAWVLRVGVSCRCCFVIVGVV